MCASAVKAGTACTERFCGPRPRRPSKRRWVSYKWN